MTKLEQAARLVSETIAGLMLAGLLAMLVLFYLP